MTTQPQPDALLPLPEAEAWVISLDCDMRGFMDAKAWKEDEFTTPLFTADQMRAYATEHAARLHAECEALLATQSDTLLRLLCDLRFALGDNGARMQPELVEYARALRADAERYRLLCEVHGPSTELCFDGRSYRGKAEFDAAIDAYRAAKEQSNG